ncbi:uncharacterized protein MYCFIDRAFT_75593 [Pseudocercospora fijiensis CIRAD86]|uniref:Low temperature requirement A n=1 Tax=Pseudocercospora fijiensis (strain CIRAD86) TaxID=383855 RepID=N1QA29_PSEFD|nr:uncharacterized protein MYCFIDRAFT_75593 [Pseudocercospora fijiensis CIRAD86]EME87753.1 hypothetical protein MYCFIDRAFT_75593 [Pseudocercospora fijiensis CIRAD86]
MSEKSLPLIPRKNHLGHETSHSTEPTIPECDENADAAQNPLRQSPHVLLVKETTPAELFYDLFFVANLAAFTYVHSVTDGRTLEQYICFFCVLWFTWFQVTLYDVRFAVDCVASRIWKAFHFCVMMGLAATGPMFKLGNKWDDRGLAIDNYLHALTLVLMASRLILVLQYLQTGLFISKYKETRMPMLLLLALYAIAATIYGSLAATFRISHVDGHSDPNWKSHNHSNNRSWLAWYLVGFAECILATAVSCKWRTIGYKGTHLVQRMSLLTLIIIGEGIITLTKSCQTIARVHSITWNPVTVTGLLCGVLILYFIYMLYFDWIDEGHHFGSIRQQVWAGLHFILHLAVVLAGQGLSLCLLWSALTYKAKALTNMFKHWLGILNGQGYNRENFDEAVRQWTDVSRNITEDEGYVAKDPATVLRDLNDEYYIREALKYMTYRNESWTNAMQLIFYTDFLAIMTITGFNKVKLYDEIEDLKLIDEKLDIPNWTLDKGRVKELAKVADMFRLTYIYFFLSLGIVVLVCTALAFLSQREKQVYHKARLSCSMLVGVGLCCMISMAFGHAGAFRKYTGSPMLIPSVAILLLLVVILNNAKPILPWGRSCKKCKQRQVFPHRKIEGEVTDEEDSGGFDDALRQCSTCTIQEERRAWRT